MPAKKKRSPAQRKPESLQRHETRGHKLAFSIGVATLEPERMTCFEDLLEQADQAMYEQKRMKRRRATERTENKQVRLTDGEQSNRSLRQIRSLRALRWTTAYGVVMERLITRRSEWPSSQRMAVGCK